MEQQGRDDSAPPTPRARVTWCTFWYSPPQSYQPAHAVHFLFSPLSSRCVTQVLYNMGNTTITFACPPPNKPVAWGSVPFDPLFQCLSHHNILTLFSCLLLERYDRLMPLRVCMIF